MVIYKLICQYREALRARGPARDSQGRLFGGHHEPCYKVYR